MKKIETVLIASLLICVLNLVADTVETPMTQELDADGYTISNVGDLITAGPYADVRVYGADPTGDEPSDTAFSEAANSGVGTVFIPKGTYKLNSPLTLSVNLIAEDGAVTINYYGTGTAITFNGSAYEGTGRIISGFKLVSKESGQSGVLIRYGIFVTARNLIINEFEGVGLQVGVAGTAGVYFANVSNIYCLNNLNQGNTGVLVDGGALPNSNANTFTNVAVKGKWTTCYHIKGHKNVFFTGNAEVNAQGTGCNDVWKIEGVNNEIKGCYYEVAYGSPQPDNVFRFTATAFGNTVRDIYAPMGMANAYDNISDQGMGNEVYYSPNGYNYAAFPVENRNSENLIPNSHFKTWKGSLPLGYNGGSCSQESSIVRGAKYSLKLVGYSGVNCYIAGHASSITGLPIERFRGKTIAAGVWVKSSTGLGTPPIIICTDGTGAVNSGCNFYTGAGTWQFLTAMSKVPEDATFLFVQFRSRGNDVYFSEPILVEGCHLPHPNPKPLNDGYARMTGPFIGSPFITFEDGDTIPDVSDGNHFKTDNSFATTITNFDGAGVGQEITIVFGDYNTTVQGSYNVRLSGGNFVSTPNDSLKLLYDGTFWYEISRSSTW